MSRFQVGTTAGDAAIADALSAASEAEIAKQLRYRLAEATYAPVRAVDLLKHRATVDLQGRSDARVELDVVGLMPVVGGQAQVFPQSGGRSYAVAVRPGTLGTGGDLSIETLQALGVAFYTDPQLAVYNTPETGETFSGQWSLLGRGTLARFGNVSATLLLSGNGPYTAGAPRGWLRLNIAQPSATAAAPLITLELVRGGTVVATDFALIVTALSTTQTAYELHARVTGTQRFLRWQVEAFHQSHAQHEWTACSAFAVSLPAGTQTTATAVS